MPELQGTIATFRSAKRRQDARTAILVVDGVADRPAAAKLLGRVVSWTRADGLSIRGSIHDVHGNGGAVLARFSRQLPPYAFPIRVKILKQRD
ncbi:MAG TPA: 50S ribosomal protein L35ae [Thermoplasmata archaeon]|nr:50S ribosomal protein L35ae [Thermoplasmata archaeon]